MIRLCLLAVLGFAASAAAAPKVALPAIEGDITGDMRDDVTSALDSSELTMLGEKEVNRVYDRLNLENLTELSEKQAKKLAKDLEADAVLTAVLAKKGRNGKTKTLKFRLYVNGKKQRGFTVHFKNAKSNKFKSALRAKVVDRLSGESQAEPAVAKETPDEGEGEVKRRKAVKPAEDEEDPNPKAKEDKQVAEQEDDEDEDTGKKKRKKKKVASSDDDDAELEASIEAKFEPQHTANRAAARLDAGMSFGNRSLVFTNRSNFPEGPKPFRSSPVPGARVEGELYPFAFVNPDSPLAGLGFAGMYDKTLKLQLETSAERGVKVPVDQSAYSFGVRFRYVIGKRATSPSIVAGVDYGRRRWKANRSGLMDRTSNNGLGSLDLPDTNYAFTAPTLGLRVPVHPMVALVADGSVLFVSKAGPIQKSDMYGKAKILGFSVGAGIDVTIANRFALRAQFEMTQFGYTFVDGGGELANGRDMDPMTQDIGGAQDRSLGGSATLGVLY
jgi:ribosomal protein L21